MSYARMGAHSDVYVYRSFADDYRCHWCRFLDGRKECETVRKSWWGIALHLMRNRLAGHKVPPGTIRAIYAERGGD